MLNRQLIDNDKKNSGENQAQPPAISLPKGGGAIRGIGEKFTANPVTGTGSFTIPIHTSPGRSGFGPQLSLSYDSGAGNGPFGFGWKLTFPAVTRKTDKGLPRYQDAGESDVFILSGMEDLVPFLPENSEAWQPVRTVSGVNYRIQRFRPRVEGLFARIERWTNQADHGDSFWRSISKDNITTWYGKTGNSRIADPSDPAHVFSWLICESHDDKGNLMVYRYKEEDSDGVDLAQAHEKNRTGLSRSANRYLKSIKYGNHTPYRPVLAADLPPMPLPKDWLFEVIFDYGEHLPDAPDPGDPGAWACRKDPFSYYRAGFEVRTYRLCRRVLMFHHFPEEPGVGANCPVRSTDFTYSCEDNPAVSNSQVFSFLKSATQTGYRRKPDNTCLYKSFPPLEFEYSRAAANGEIHEVGPESLENLPSGLDSLRCRWVDLDGEGLSGILTEQGNGWFYKRNISPVSVRQDARFGPAELVAEKPSQATAGNGRWQFLDLAGDGLPDLVDFQGPAPGFYKHAPDGRWKRFTPFTSLPVLDWDNPGLKFIDLTGDGRADILISDDGIFCWYPSLAETGFGPAEAVCRALDEEHGPRLLSAGGDNSIYLADMSGDGLTDILRIRNGEVCYWPNLGYGCFGAKVTMDNSPWFDQSDLFNQQQIYLADIDGSGTTDIIYLGYGGARLYFNQSGNSWSKALTLSQFPRTDNLSEVTVVDLLGSGTACLVWSSSLPGDTRPMRYIDLTGGQKPHLLLSMKNNLGAVTRVTYAPSTRFYLSDKLAGKPWVTKLPFPVHVVERVETYDHISRNRFVTCYAYHHGYFDGMDQEFRGFGMIEQWDTEEFAALSDSGDLPAGNNTGFASHVPPVLTRTWFHNGAFFEGKKISRQYTFEYYGTPAKNDPQFEQKWRDFTADLLPDTSLPPNLSARELREAFRALKGSLLRREVYILDGSEKEPLPYSVSERDYSLKCLQPMADNRHAVFFAHQRETIDYHCERNPADPRVSHTLVLDTDSFGNVLQFAAISYGRRQADPALEARDQAKQARTLITCTENGFTNHIDTEDNYRTPLPCEVRAYELTGLNQPAGGRRFSFNEILNAAAAATPICYEQDPLPALLQKRLFENVRTIYRRNDLAGPLPPGQVESLALPFENYKLAFTPGLVAGVYGDRVTGDMLEKEGGYVHSGGDSNWWIPSGQVFYSPGDSDTTTREMACARRHFFLPNRLRDPFGHTTTISYDPYDLMVQETRDPLGNRATAGERSPDGSLSKQGNDYRVLQPMLVMDPNRNRSAVAFDVLGMPVGTAVMGKPGESLGDSLDGFEPDLTDAGIAAYLEDPFADPLGVLRRATTRLIYDLFAFRRTQDGPEPQPAAVYTMARETHDAGLAPGQLIKIQHSFSYSDGFGREIQKKIPAEPGPLNKGRPEASPRWVGSGWNIFNNKGKPVRQYEPFFSATHCFEFARADGVSPILFYDPAGRVVATLHPNHTYDKVVFDPWRQEMWDVNDTLNPLERFDPRAPDLLPDHTFDPAGDPDVGAFFQRLPQAEYLPTWYDLRMDAGKAASAWPGADPLTGMHVPENAVSRAAENEAAKKAARHASTPSVTFLDSLGRPFLTLADNGLDNSGVKQEYKTRAELDIEGNQLAITDAAGRVVMRYNYGLSGNRIRQAGMEAGERLTLSDAAGKPIFAWDSRGHTFRTVYDGLRRPTELNLQKVNEPELLAQRNVYGETQPNPETNNLRGRVVKVFDGAGVVTSDEYDFKGNLLQSSRQLAAVYKTVPDWSAPVAMEAETHTSRTVCDALNRPVFLTAPDGSITRLTYNEAGLLEQVETCLRAAAATTLFVKSIDYNSKGQRDLIEYGNGVSTAYTYDPLTFRLARLQTTRGAERLQDLRYTYDPAGNVTDIRDHAQQTVFFNNTLVEPRSVYTYDAVYRLIEAAGREHLGQSGGQCNPPASPDAFNHFHTRLDHPGDGKAMGTYFETYVYDAVGNIMSLQHRGADPAHPGWRRAYTYNEASRLEPGQVSNRLSSTSTGTTTENYRYDGSAGLHGNITAMPHLPTMRWDYRDQLQAVSRQVLNGGGTPETTYYIYDAGGRRVRKVTERQAAAGQTPARMNERIYLGGFEVYREYSGDGSTTILERETLHLMDDRQRIALVETRTRGSDAAPAQLIRYQTGNHLGSASLELDAAGQIISYEEYYPFGSTSYQAVRSRTETPKRYRYTGQERDEESGLYHHGARYYSPWLGRWTSCDPAGLKGGFNLYEYAYSSPIRYADKSGLAPENTSILERMFKSLEEGLEYLNKIASQGKERGLAEKDGLYHVFKGVEDEVTFPSGYTAVAHTHEKGFCISFEDYTTTKAQGVDIGGVKTHLVTMGENQWSIIEIPKKGAATATTLNLKTGKIEGIIELEAKGVNPDRYIPHVAETMKKLDQAAPISDIGGLAKMLRGSTPLKKALGIGLTGARLLGSGLNVAGFVLSGIQIYQGIDQVMEGKKGEGTVDIVAGSTDLGLSIFTWLGMKSGAIAVEGGAAAGGMAFASAVAAAGSILWATEDIKRSLRGEDTLPYEAVKYYADLVEEGKDEGGFSGFGMQAAGWAGGLVTAPISYLQGYWD